MCLLVEYNERIVQLLKNTTQVIAQNVTTLKSDLQEISARMEDIGTNVSCKFILPFLYIFQVRFLHF